MIKRPKSLFTVQGQEEINDKHAVRRVANEEWQQYIVVYTHRSFELE